MAISVNTSVNSVPNDPEIAPAPQTGSPGAGKPARQRVVVSEPPASRQDTLPAPEASPPSVTFRRDANGQIYYVITDSDTGKELGQVPPEAVRKVGEGIAEYLKREQEKQITHVKVKA
jgi:hypothetical protein